MGGIFIVQTVQVSCFFDSYCSVQVFEPESRPYLATPEAITTIQALIARTAPDRDMPAYVA